MKTQFGLGTVRKRTWTTRKGANKIAWLVSYTDHAGKRKQRAFADKKAALAGLRKLRDEGKVRDGNRARWERHWLAVAEHLFPGM